MPNNISPGSATQSTINTMDTTPTNTKILKPVGALSVFPREIRDEIYRHVFPTSKRYRAFYSSSICRPSYYEKPDDFAHTDFKREEWIGSDLSLLRLSKAIKEEAMPLLYSEGTFCFCESLNPDNIDVLQHQNADAINRMTNIELFLGAAYVPQLLAATKSYHRAGAGPLEFFQGVSVMRKSIFIVLVLFNDEWLDDATAMVARHLSKVLKHLTGFQTVTQRLVVRPYDCPLAKEWQDERGWAKWLETLLSAMSQDLELTLGNSSAMSELLSGAEDFGFYRQTHVTFHPRDHVVATSKAKKDAIEMKHSKGTKWIKG